MRKNFLSSASVISECAFHYVVLNISFFQAVWLTSVVQTCQGWSLQALRRERIVSRNVWRRVDPVERIRIIGAYWIQRCSALCKPKYFVMHIRCSACLDCVQQWGADDKGSHKSVAVDTDARFPDRQNSTRDRLFTDCWLARISRDHSVTFRLCRHVYLI